MWCPHDCKVGFSCIGNMYVCTGLYIYIYKVGPQTVVKLVYKSHVTMDCGTCNELVTVDFQTTYNQRALLCIYIRYVCS